MHWLWVGKRCMTCNLASILSVQYVDIAVDSPFSSPRISYLKFKKYRLI